MQLFADAFAEKEKEFCVCGFMCTDTSEDNKKIGRLHVVCVICQW